MTIYSEPKKGDAIEVTCQSELMQNEFLESKIDVANGIRTLKYQEDKPAVFFIDKSQHLHVAFGNHQVTSLVDEILNTGINFGSGWLLKKLSNDPVTSFDVAFVDKEKTLFRIAISKQVTGGTEVVLSNELSTKQSLSELLGYLNFESVATENIIVKQMTLSAKGLLYAGTESGVEVVDTFFWHEYGKQRTKESISVSGEEILQVSHGVLGKSRRGMAFILSRSQSKDLIMRVQQFPYEGGLNKKVGEEIQGFDLSVDESGKNILYVADKEGIARYEGLKLEKEVITKAGDFSKIRVVHHNGIETIWALGEVKGISGLFYMTNGKYTDTTGPVVEGPERWTAPLLMSKGVEDFDCIRGTQLSNQLFFFSTEKKALVHLWQDAWSGKWEEELVNLNLREVKTRETFSANIHFESTESLLIFNDQCIQLSAKNHVSVYINERQVLLGPERKVKVKLKGNDLCIVFPTNDISPHTLLLDAEWLQDTIAIRPAQALHKKIHDVFCDSGKLRAAQKGQGAPLISGVEDKDLDAVVDASKKVFGIVNPDRDYAVANGGLFSFSFDESAVPISISSPSFTAAATALKVGNSFHDFWYAVKKGLVKLKSLAVQIVDGCYKILIEVGGRLMEFITRSADSLMSCLERVWEGIKVFFKDVFECFAFLLDWKDMLLVKDALKGVLLTSVTNLERQLPMIKKRVNAEFLKVEGNLEERISKIKFKDQGDIAKVGKDSGQKKVDTRATWMNSKMTHLSGTDDSAYSVNSGGVIDDFMERARKLQGGVGVELKSLVKDIERVFNNKLDLGEFLNILLLRLAKVASKVCKHLLALIFDMIEALISGFITALNQKIEIPFFSDLYKRISGSDLTMLDLSSLVIAVPTSILYKLASKTSMFADDKAVNGFVSSFEIVNSSGTGQQERTWRNEGTDTKKLFIAGCIGLVRGFIHFPKEMLQTFGAKILGIIDALAMITFIYLTNKYLQSMSSFELLELLTYCSIITYVSYAAVSLKFTTTPLKFTDFLRHMLKPTLSLIGVIAFFFKSDKKTEDFVGLSQSVLAMGHFYPLYKGVLEPNPQVNASVQFIRGLLKNFQGFAMIVRASG